MNSKIPQDRQISPAFEQLDSSRVKSDDCSADPDLVTIGGKHRPCLYIEPQGPALGRLDGIVILQVRRDDLPLHKDESSIASLRDIKGAASQKCYWDLGIGRQFSEGMFDHIDRTSHRRQTSVALVVTWVGWGVS